jgi:nicotinate dehydrogenase subunit A
MPPIDFVVNGTVVRIGAPESTPLLHVLREHLNLKGTRFGCGVEQCGCCMMLIDGSAEKSCAKPIWSVAGKAVTTIEGLGTRDQPHPLQRAFIEEQAGQCGYCLSGILIAAKALLDRYPSPSRRDVAEALDGNICRCGSHNRIIRAVQHTAEMLRRDAAT